MIPTELSLPILSVHCAKHCGWCNGDWLSLFCRLEVKVQWPHIMTASWQCPPPELQRIPCCLFWMTPDSQTWLSQLLLCPKTCTILLVHLELLSPGSWSDLGYVFPQRSTLHRMFNTWEPLCFTPSSSYDLSLCLRKKALLPLGNPYSSFNGSILDFFMAV